MSFPGIRVVKWTFSLFVSCLAAVACGSSGSSPTTPTPGANRAPVIGSIVVSPTGTGLQSATIFTFTGQAISDPDGDALTFAWTSSDGAAMTSTTQAASKVFSQSGTFEVRLTATDAKGLSTSAAASVPVATVTGTWDVTCDNRSTQAQQLWPNFPSVFVVTLAQFDKTVTGSMSGGGLSRNFTYPGNVADPRLLTVGVETIDNVWTNRDGDFYFRLGLSDTLRSGVSTSNGFYCGSSTATKR